MQQLLNRLIAKHRRRLGLRLDAVQPRDEGHKDGFGYSAGVTRTRWRTRQPLSERAPLACAIQDVIMRKIGRQGEGVLEVVMGAFQSVRRSRWRGVGELNDRGEYPAPDIGAVVIAVCR